MPAEATMEGLLLKQLITATVFSAVGVAVFAVAFWAMCRLAGFSVRKEIAEDHNTALAVVMGSVILGIAIIVASAVHG